MRHIAFLLLFLYTCASFSSPAHADENSPKPQYAAALHGNPKYPADFKHLNYVNPDAPKGGTLHNFAIGTFDSLNPFLVKGMPAAGLEYLRSDLIYESLMQNTMDEPFSLYGIIAQSITIAPDRSWVEFKLRPEAKWADSQPITADDVVWTFETLTSKGQPFFKAYWNDVEKATALDEKTVRFDFKTKGNAELPLIIAEMTILPKHFWTDGKHDFEKTSLEPPLGSGPYKIGKVVAGSSIEYVRNENWWGKDLPYFKGFYNFDKIIWDYYRDENVAHEAFLAGNFDTKIENTAKLWKTGYDIPAVKEGKLKMEIISNNRPTGMQAFIYNLRRPLFQDIKIRQALAYAFDFEWSNKQFAFGEYVRTNSYFENSDLAATSTPSAEELKILDPLRGKIPNEVFSAEYNPPKTDGSGNIRENMRAAIKILEEAGYTKLDNNGIRFKETDDKKIQKLEFEILYYSPVFERWVMPFLQNLKRIGVKANFRTIDTAQYQNRINDFDYDMTIMTIGQSESPGNEQREFWGSDKADIKGSRNYMGIKDPVIDDLVTQIIHASSREELVTKTRALDRILLWNHYAIPMWHYPKWRIAYWDHIQHPKQLSGMSPLITSTWWSAKALKKEKQ